MATLIRQAVAADLPMHEPLRFPLYDENGRLLLKQGFVITMPGFAERLLLRGCYIGNPEDPPAAANTPADGVPADGSGEADSNGIINDKVRPTTPQAPVFLRACDLATSVRRIHKLLLEPPSDRVVVQDFIRDRARLLLSLLAEDSDAVLAAAYLTHDVRDGRPYQQLLGAIVAAQLAPQCELGEGQRLALVCAALTRDTALHEIDKSYATARELPEIAQLTVREHPLAAVKLLLQHGINDRDWLTFVAEHHERPDGSGYPNGKKEGELQAGSMLLGLADVYAGMVLANLRRPGIFPANALKEIFLGKGSKHPEKQVVALLKTLTRFPAGTLVSLANGEIGLIKNPPPSQSQPQVYSVYDRSGMPRSAPVIRDSNQSEFAITGCVAPEKCQSAALVIRRLWQ